MYHRGSKRWKMEISDSRNFSQPWTFSEFTWSYQVSRDDFHSYNPFLPGMVLNIFLLTLGVCGGPVACQEEDPSSSMCEPQLHITDGLKHCVTDGKMHPHSRDMKVETRISGANCTWRENIRLSSSREPIPSKAWSGHPEDRGLEWRSLCLLPGKCPNMGQARERKSREGVRASLMHHDSGWSWRHGALGNVWVWRPTEVGSEPDCYPVLTIRHLVCVPLGTVSTGSFWEWGIRVSSHYSRELRSKKSLKHWVSKHRTIAPSGKCKVMFLQVSGYNLHQPICTEPYLMCFCLKTPYFIYIFDSLTLISWPAATPLSLNEADLIHIFSP